MSTDQSTIAAIKAVNPGFVISRQGKDAVLYAGLLDQAHRSGLKRIGTKLLQAPADDNQQTAICWAEVETAAGTFSGIGDANPANVGRMVALHIIRMAETRAKARALRDALNVGGVSLEELGPDDEDEERPMRASSRATAPAPVPAANDIETLYSQLLAAQTAIHDLTGQDVEIPEGMDVAAATARLEELRLVYANAKPARAAAQPAGKAASTQQIDRLHKLQAALGRPAVVPTDLTEDAAAAQIAELVKQFNQQSRGQTRGGAR